ncbi:MAG: hypothetical protein V1806_12895 [Pseudomonadota bacterium]
MDRLTISSASNLGADYQGLGNLKRRNPRSEEEEFPSLPGAGQGETTSQTTAENNATAATTTPASVVAKDLALDMPPLTRRQAGVVLQELTPAIAQTSPWKLAEIQPVSERSLLPSAYV